MSHLKPYQLKTNHLIMNMWQQLLSVMPIGDTFCQSTIENLTIEFIKYRTIVEYTKDKFIDFDTSSIKENQYLIFAEFTKMINEGVGAYDFLMCLFGNVLADKYGEDRFNIVNTIGTKLALNIFEKKDGFRCIDLRKVANELDNIKTKLTKMLCDELTL